jgi:hypothetical protein
MAAAVVVILVAVAARTHAAVDDHLVCHKAADALAVEATVTIDAQRLGMSPGCTLGRAKLYCTPATKTVTASSGPILPIDGPPLADARICYRVRCKERPPNERESDQFGTHTFRKLAPRLLCTPAVPGPPVPATTALDHLACYAGKDALKTSATVDVAAGGDSASGCELKRAKLLCVGASAMVVSSNQPTLFPIGGPGLDVDRVCYRASCPDAAPASRTVSDRFGEHAISKLKPKYLCTPAVPGDPPGSTTTSTTTATSSTTSTTMPSDPLLACQRTIEASGLAYANVLLDLAEGCAAPGQPLSMTSCLASASATATVNAQRTAMVDAITAACDGIDVWRDLGYLTTCDAAPSSCTGPSGTLPGLGECFACKLGEILRWTVDRLFANAVPSSACHTALGTTGLATLRSVLDATATCLGQPGTVSLASCFDPDAAVATWRASAASACALVNPFTNLGYPILCSGEFPTAVAFCGTHAYPCTFSQMSQLSTPASSDDLLDCLGCQLEEAVLATGRTLHGANLCCIGGACDTVRTRYACASSGGAPVHYTIGTRDVGSISGPHGIDVDDAGTLYLADSGYSRVKKVTAAGVETVLSSTPPFPVGVAAGPSGDVYVTNRCEQQVKVIPAGGGPIAPFAGTGTPGTSGDGGPALAANIVAPDGIAVDAMGRVFFTNSPLLGFLCNTPTGAESVRYVDTSGIIHTFVSVVPGPPPGLGVTYGLHFGFDGTLFVGEAGTQRVFAVDPMGTVQHVAGRPLGPVGIHSGYGGPAARARFYENCGVDGDADGNVIVGPMTDNRIALVDKLGSVIAIAGTGNGSFGPPAGDGGPGLLGEAACPEDLVVAPDGRIYYSDLMSNRIRVLTRVPY